jgi:HEPN domain
LPPRDSRDHSRLLLSKAQADKVVIDKLADDSDVTDETIGFHAQQAVEKLIKAALASRGIEYPRTHDIDRLVDLLAANAG